MQTCLQEPKADGGCLGWQKGGMKKGDGNREHSPFQWWGWLHGCICKSLYRKKSGRVYMEFNMHAYLKIGRK